MSTLKNFGRYEIIDLLGQGGMGTVYKAFDPLLARVVAIKVISTQLNSQPDLRDRFFREARSAAQLSHRHIITIHDLGEEGGQPFLTMQFLEGRDLEQRMRATDGMSLTRKLEIALAVTEGLAHAHGAGVIHRDIKPANVFITDDGQVKILDFGLARLTSSELTHSNVMVGTVNYMAPEQLRGEKTDQRSDIFSLGVVLYELFAGKKPFQADSFASTMYKILQEEPEPLDRLVPDLPPGLVAVVNRAMAKAREDRYQLMTDMLRDLEAVYEPLRGSDRRIISQVESALRPLTDGKPRSHPPTLITSPDAETIVGTPVPDFVRAMVGSTASASVPSSPAGVTGSTPPPAVAPRTGISPWVFFGLAAAGLVVALVAFKDYDRTPIATPKTVTATPPASSVPAQLPSPAPPQAPEPQAPPAPPLPAPPGPVASGQPDGAEVDSVEEQVARALRRAKSAIEGRRPTEAAAAASEALSLDESNKEAQRILARLAADGRAHVKQASVALSQAKEAAVAADARELAPQIFAEGERQEAGARAAADRSQFEQAAVQLDAAASLFRSAESTARSESEARNARARVAEEARRPPEPAPRPEPAVPEAAPKPAPPPPAPPAPAVHAEPPVLPPRTASSREAVAGVVGRYTTALQRRDIDALKAIWPSLDGAQQAALQMDFANARSITVDFVDPKIDITGTAATVRGVRHYAMQTRDGQQLRSTTITTLQLRQVGNDWIIESVRHQAAR